MALVPPRDRLGRRPGRRHGPRQDGADARAAARGEEPEDAKIEGQAASRFKALIVAPTSVVTNWLREIDKFAPSLAHALWHGAERKERQDELEDADVVVTSYALLRRDEEMLKKLDWRYVILDEAQHIKNPLSATARAAKRLEPTGASRSPARRSRTA